MARSRFPRSELTKKLWDYIKKNGLQDKKKRTQINADDAMKPVFNGKSQVSMFEMTKLVSGHLKSTNRLTSPFGLTAESRAIFGRPRAAVLLRGRLPVRPGDASPERTAVALRRETSRRRLVAGENRSRSSFLAAALCAFGLGSARAEANWLTDFAKAQQEAKASHKLLLLDFTGSDWCSLVLEAGARRFSRSRNSRNMRRRISS